MKKKIDRFIFWGVFAYAVYSTIFVTILGHEKADFIKTLFNNIRSYNKYLYYFLIVPIGLYAAYVLIKESTKNKNE